MKRVLLLLPTSSYRASDFIAAAGKLDVELVVGSEHRAAMADSMGDRAIVVPLANLDQAVAEIVALDDRAPIDAIVAVDDQGIEIAAAALGVLGLTHNRTEAVAATRDKSKLRALLDASEILQPRFHIVPGLPGDQGEISATVAVEAAAQIGYPCVIKPVSRSGSQGVIRVNNESEAFSATMRIREIVGDCDEALIVEEFISGDEVALEGLLVAGDLQVLAIFDKPDPLDGPYFEETIYVTPSRHGAALLLEIERTVARAAAAIGLSEGPIHAELRIRRDESVVILELAARSIGGLCSRALRFGVGVSLEELIIRHALGMGTDGIVREAQASGVMMLPIRSEGILEGVQGQDIARAIDGIVGLEISIPGGRPLVPLPKGDRYLGFIFARGPSPEFVEAALRSAEAQLDVVVRQ